MSCCSPTPLSLMVSAYFKIDRFTRDSPVLWVGERKTIEKWNTGELTKLAEFLAPPIDVEEPLR